MNEKIIVVDDDQDILNAIKIILESQNYKVILAHNKEEGLEKINTEKPDLAILDVMMDATHDGFDMAREIKKSEEFKDLPIIMLTSIDVDTGVQFKSSMSDPNWLPADGYLDKPVEPEALLEEVKKYFP